MNLDQHYKEVAEQARQFAEERITFTSLFVRARARLLLTNLFRGKDVEIPGKRGNITDAGIDAGSLGESALSTVLLRYLNSQGSDGSMNFSGRSSAVALGVICSRSYQEIIPELLLSSAAASKPSSNTVPGFPLADRIESAAFSEFYSILGLSLMGKAGVDFLIRNLTNESRERRLVCVVAIGHIKFSQDGSKVAFPEFFDPLVERMGDENLAIKVHAAKSLIQVCENVAAHADLETVRQTLEKLGSIGWGDTAQMARVLATKAYAERIAKENGGKAIVPLKEDGVLSQGELPRQKRGMFRTELKRFVA